ncbi:hypothetical protein CYL16_01120 [Mycobacterium sp. EPG1]|nr:hypothetical protein CYL16_01120 [Mycobacterium sp. EPG1]
MADYEGVDMAETTLTWQVYLDRLTPEQIAFLRRCDANPNHSSGTYEGHRRGMLAVARMYAQMGPGGLN